MSSNFNPRPPCGGRPATSIRFTNVGVFQSTSPVWRTTYATRNITTTTRFQSTSPVWRTTQQSFDRKDKGNISIHVPRVEDDKQDSPTILRIVYFNPRPPCGGRHADIPGANDGIDISIHVPRVEDDEKARGPRPVDENFNPRPPCGGRHTARAADMDAEEFQSTSPVWRTTQPPAEVDLVVVISIHVPRVEDDVRLLQKQGKISVFQSTSPVWRTTSNRNDGGFFGNISIHVPRVEDDSIQARIRDATPEFQSTSPVWRTT